MKKPHLAAIAAFGALSLTGCERVRDNQAAIVTVYGRVTEVRNEPNEKGLIIRCCVPGRDVDNYTLRNQEVTASTNEEMAGVANRLVLRTKDGYQVEGSVIAKFNIDASNEANFQRLFTELTSQGEDAENGYKDDLQRIILVAASEAISQYNGTDLTNKPFEVGEAIQRSLQTMVDSRKWPFDIVLISPNLGLTSEANRLFEQNAQLDARNTLAVKRTQVAAQEALAAAAEAAAPVNVYEAYRNAGAGEAAAIEGTCLFQAAQGKPTNGPCLHNTATAITPPRP